MFFDYVLPDAAAGSKKPDDNKKPPAPQKPPPKDKGGPVHTQMVGEKPGDDLGYDPKKIPVEPIE